MEDDREHLRDWLRALSRQTGLSLTAIAEGAGIKGTTLTRFVNDDAHPHNLSRTTIRKIEQRFATRAPGGDGLTERGAAAFMAREDARETKDSEEKRASHEVIMVTDNALDLRGLRHGDLCDLDRRAEPRPGDLVLIEHRNSLHRTERIVRIFSPPYLLAHATNAELNRPLLIEPGRISILGVLTRLVRPLRIVS